ncbi:TAXI family TRAP transporter solute-binding subunit [Aestuariivita sp.]|jgi:TRAP transporter TAXI family solute receptor|uniref:TAXI family TRAP transporter solute-binding subunit n=1 Tax=Aestuariivita sp. TaxID=1872407 RepID=UPI00216D12CB|nr:TAXI family TRAP transporter solute-binding subunit [Aestuariivita sp.]MCE8006119.1 TAXI family TRAP transporter solute-binding subunit [Aestuariivita sp.]
MNRLLNRRCLLRAATAAVLATASISVATASFAEDPAFLNIGGGPSGGTFNVVATGLGDLMRDEFPRSIVGVQPGGSGPNLLRVAAGDADLGITSASNATDAWAGRDPATPDNPIKNVRGLMTFFPSAIQIWVDASSDIYTIEDLVGRQISAGQPGQTSWNAFNNLLDVHGMTIEDLQVDGGRVHHLSWSESQNALRDGQLDAVMWVALYPHSTVLATETAREIRVLSLDEERVAEYLERHGGGFEKVTLPVGLYQGQTEPAVSVGTSTFLFASEDMADETAYRVTSAIWNNLERFQRTHALLDYIDTDTAGRGMFVPIHPGAARFFEEQGIAMDAPVLN